MAFFNDGKRVREGVGDDDTPLCGSTHAERGHDVLLRLEQYGEASVQLLWRDALI